MEETIGFIGLGIMGKPMALNLLKAGYRLCVFNISTPVLDELERNGAEIKKSPKAVAESCSIIITMLPDSPQVHDVALGVNGIINGLSAGKLYIDMSTIDVSVVEEINLSFGIKGVECLDAPVSGGQIGAQSGNLSIMVGGSEQAFKRALPVFNVLGKKISHMGIIGSGQITKSCSQIATALATQGVIEAFAFAQKAGVDIGKVREALMAGFAQSKALDIAGRKIIERDFSPGFKLGLYRKDLRIAQDAASNLSVKLPGTELLSEEMDVLLAKGSGDLDFSALINVFEA